VLILELTYSFAVDDHPGVTLIIIWILHNLISKSPG